MWSSRAFQVEGPACRLQLHGRWDSKLDCFRDLIITVPARRYASAGTIATALCLCYVCLSVCYESVFYRNGWTDRAEFLHVCLFRPIPHSVLVKFRYLRNNGTSFWNFVPNSLLRKFRHGISIVETFVLFVSQPSIRGSATAWTYFLHLGYPCPLSFRLTLPREILSRS